MMELSEHVAALGQNLRLPTPGREIRHPRPPHSEERLTPTTGTGIATGVSQLLLMASEQGWSHSTGGCLDPQ